MFQWFEKICISFLCKRGYYVCSNTLLVNSFKSFSKEIERKEKKIQVQAYTIQALSIALDDMEDELYGDIYE